MPSFSSEGGAGRRQRKVYCLYNRAEQIRFFPLLITNLFILLFLFPYIIKNKKSVIFHYTLYPRAYFCPPRSRALLWSAFVGIRREELCTEVGACLRRRHKGGHTVKKQDMHLRNVSILQTLCFPCKVKNREYGELFYKSIIYPALYVPPSEAHKVK